MRQISKAFPGVQALDEVEFDVQRGEVHVLVGENGAGKSTLMKILAGAYERDAGEILLDGRPVELASPRAALDSGISIIHQEQNLVPHMTAAENILLGREPVYDAVLGLLRRREATREAQQALSALEVQIDPNATIRRLGVAERQMVEIARALSTDARIIVMDEPTAALAERETQQLFATIRRLRSEGVSIIYISHRLSEIFEVGDRVTVLRDGKRVGTLATDQATPQQIIRMMVGRELQEMYPKEGVELGPELLRVEALTREPALHDISFSVRAGEILGIAGLMGSGRTELARAIFGADHVDAGDIEVEGQPVRIRHPRDAVRSGIAFLTEDRKSQGLAINLPLRVNVTLASLWRFVRGLFISRRAEEQATERYVGELRIQTPSLEQRMTYLSGGNQQKAVIAKWLCTRAKVFLFDEPTRGIDVGAKVDVFQLIENLARRGAAIVMISSELPELLAMSDRIAVLCEGRLAAVLPAADATQEQILAYATGATTHEQ
jgi:ribose transport system ATP-binding protein